jgi:hypothetical protein
LRTAPSHPPRFACGFAWRSLASPRAKRVRHSPKGDDGQLEHPQTASVTCLGLIQTPPGLLIETGIIKDRTSYKSIKTAVINAGGKWEDRKRDAPERRGAALAGLFLAAVATEILQTPYIMHRN